MSDKELHVPISTGGTMLLLGEKIGPIFVHQYSRGRWRLTHVGTGLRFPWEWSTRKKARDAARRINGHCDLDALIKAEAGQPKHSDAWIGLGKFVLLTAPIPHGGVLYNVGDKKKRDRMTHKEMRKFAERQ